MANDDDIQVVHENQTLDLRNELPVSMANKSDVSLHVDSEVSYDPLYTSDELQECITFLNYNIRWLCVSTSCNVILLSLVLYRECFNVGGDSPLLIQLVIVVSDLVIITDVVAAVVYYFSKSYSYRKFVHKKSTVLLILDIISLISIPLSLVYVDSYPIFIINCICLAFRNHRIGAFFYILSKTSGCNKITYLMFKYGVIFFFVTHIYACIWMSLGCFHGKSEGCTSVYDSWTYELNHFLDSGSKRTSILYYVFCMFYAINTITAMGLSGATDGSYKEQMLTITLMFIGLYLINGLFIGAFTSVQIESYKKRSIFGFKLDLILSSLDDDNIPKPLKDKISNFYVLFWQRKGAVSSSKLFLSLPCSMQDQVLLDKYWIAMNKSHVLQCTSNAFKRVLARLMYAEIYTGGEVIYCQNKIKDIMLFVARGSVQILSSDDSESVLLTLGMESCISDISLLYSLRNKVQIISSGYCEIFCLKKSDLWRAACNMRLLNPSGAIHEVLKRTIRVAKLKHAYKRSSVDNLRDNTVPSKKVKLGGVFVNTVRTTSCRYIRDNAISDLYIVNKEELEHAHRDGIFVKTTFPWVLRPDSGFLFGWECFFVLLIGFVSFLYPWQVMALGERSKFEYMINCFTCVIYTVDFLLKIFTAIEEDKGLYTKFSDLIAKRCSELTFVLDVAAVAPLELKIISEHKHRTFKSFLQLNRLFLIYRIVNFIRTLENSFKMNVLLVRCAKYVIYLLYLAYFIGVIYYMVACNDICFDDSWVNRYLEVNLLARRNLSETHLFETAILYAMLLVSGTGGHVLANNLLELIIVTVVCVLGTLVFTYLISDYLATLTLAGRYRYLYIEMICIIRKFMIQAHMAPSEQHRLNNYLEAQWIYNNGVRISDLLADCPQHLYVQYQLAKYASVLANLPLFKGLGHDVIAKIAAHSETVFFPPNESIIYSREMVTEMYIVEKGVCEVISPASGRIEKVIGPEDNFSVIDMILELPGIFHVRTITHVSVLKIPYALIKESFTNRDKEVLLNLALDIKYSFTVQRLFTESEAYVTQKIVKEDLRSFVRVPDKLDERWKEYISSWKVLRLCRYLMMPYTIVPCGNFITYYEIVRAVCAFISAMTFPTSYFYYVYIPYFAIIHAVLDLCAFADIYVRLHVCYYNDKGILVTHPKSTAQNYLCGSFIVDLLGCIPLDVFLSMFWTNNFPEVVGYNKMCAILRMNRIIQVYRIPDAFSLFTRDIMATKLTMVNLIKYSLISVTFFNFFAGICVCSSCSIVGEWKGDMSDVVAGQTSWLNYINLDINTSYAINIYLLTFYYVSSQALQIGFGDISVFYEHEILLVVITMVTGYLWFTYVLVIISNSTAVINVKRTLYQNYMKQVICFMKRENLNRDLQKKTVNHFEYVWQRTHGLRTGKILSRCDLALSKDCALHLYEETLKEIPIFKDMSNSFFRVICTHVEDYFYLSDNSVVQLNDIVKNTYVVHIGHVKVLGPDGARLATLTKGSIFGNIDEVEYTRSMISVVALTMVDILCIKTTEFYALINAYPVVANRLKRHILLDNLCYVESKYEEEDIDTVVKKMNLMYIPGEKIQLSRKMKILCSEELKLALMLASYFSCIHVTYQASFQDYNAMQFGLSYFLDLVHIFKLYLGFITPYKNHMGDMVVDPKSIIRRYLTPSRFYVELFGSLPTDLLYFAFTPKYALLGLTYMRLNRFLRMVNVYNYFNVTHDYLNINVLAIKLSSIFIMYLLLIHIQACFWFLLACPTDQDCRESSWIVGDFSDICNYNYICALYFATSIATFTGYPSPHPRTTVEVMSAMWLIVINKFVMGVFIGNMTSIVHNVNFSLIRYNHRLGKLKEYLSHSKISEALAAKVLTYNSQLWDRNNGKQVPVYLGVCPNFLQQELNIAAFGRHIYENAVFANCHVDFQRQLIAKFKMFTYFNGDIICQQGDVNDTMFFVHQGIVQVYKVTESEETLIDELQENDSFGILQGMVRWTPHTHTFVAMNVTVMLSLTYSDWCHLMLFFPASKYSMLQSIEVLWR